MTEVPGLDVAGLSAWLTEAHPELVDGPVEASVIAGGRSNLTYAVDGTRTPLIVRRPPLGHVLSVNALHQELDVLVDIPFGLRVEYVRI